MEPTAATRTQTLRLSAHGGAARAEAVGRRRRGPRVTATRNPLVPRGVGGILDTALEILLTRFGPCWGSAFLLWLPAQFGLFLLIRAQAFDLQIFWQVTIAFLVETFSLLFIARIVGGAMEGRRVGIGEAFLNGLRCFPGMALLGGVAGIVQFFGMCMCLAPGFVVQWLFSVVPVVYSLERVSLGESLSRGFKLVTGGSSFLRWLGWFTVSSLLMLPFGLAVSGLQEPTLIAEIEGLVTIRGTALDLLLATVGALFLAFTTAFSAILRAVYYVDCRVRTEGLDLELWLERRAPGGPTW